MTALRRDYLRDRTSEIIDKAKELNCFRFLSRNRDIHYIPCKRLAHRGAFDITAKGLHIISGIVEIIFGAGFSAVMAIQ